MHAVRADKRRPTHRRGLTSLPFLCCSQADVNGAMLLSGFINCQSSTAAGGATVVRDQSGC
jgi:hypothetical protein